MAGIEAPKIPIYHTEGEYTIMSKDNTLEVLYGSYGNENINYNGSISPVHAQNQMQTLGEANYLKDVRANSNNIMKDARMFSIPGSFKVTEPEILRTLSKRRSVLSGQSKPLRPYNAAPRFDATMISSTRITLDAENQSPISNAVVSTGWSQSPGSASTISVSTFKPSTASRSVPPAIDDRFEKNDYIVKVRVPPMGQPLLPDDTPLDLSAVDQITAESAVRFCAPASDPDEQTMINILNHELEPPQTPDYNVWDVRNIMYRFLHGGEMSVSETMARYPWAPLLEEGLVEQQVAQPKRDQIVYHVTDDAEFIEMTSF